MLRNPSFAGHQTARSVADGSVVKVADCKRCGHAIGWIKSSKSGKWYPCEIHPKRSEEYGANWDTLRAYPFEVHKCQPAEVERHAAIEAACKTETRTGRETA